MPLRLVEAMMLMIMTTAKRAPAISAKLNDRLQERELVASAEITSKLKRISAVPHFLKSCSYSFLVLVWDLEQPQDGDRSSTPGWPGKSLVQISPE